MPPPSIPSPSVVDRPTVSSPPSAYTKNVLGDRVSASLKKEGVRQNSSRFRSFKKVELTKLAQIKDVPVKERPALFIEKVLFPCICTSIFILKNHNQYFVMYYVYKPKSYQFFLL